MEIRITRESVSRFLGTVIALGIVALLVFALARAVLPDDPFSGQIKEDRFQAVVLSDGRIFFGRLRSVSEEYLELSEAYFVDQTEVQEGQPATQRVVPITDRIEGPEDSMLLNKEYVVVVENLRPDSDVVEAIEEVQAAGG